MCLHVYVIFGHCFILAADPIAFSYSLAHPENLKNQKYLASARIILVTTEACTQAVLLYLFTKLSEPISVTIATD